VVLNKSLSVQSNGVQSHLKLKEQKLMKKRESYKLLRDKIQQKIPSVTNIIFRGSPSDIMVPIKEALISNNFEWQFVSKELKLKCRTRINGSDMWDDLSDGFNLDDFMKKDFVKFTIQI
jgi:hypothetical protein